MFNAVGGGWVKIFSGVLLILGATFSEIFRDGGTKQVAQEKFMDAAMGGDPEEFIEDMMDEMKNGEGDNNG